MTEEHQDWSVEHWGKVTFGTRIFLDDPAHTGQKGNNFSLTFEPTIYSESAEGNSFTFTPFIMIDSVDSERTHVDIREAYYLTFGSLGESEWELRIGIDQVFWGTAESHNPVNVINQTDYVVHPNGESKLGQPMVHGTLAGDWGMLDAFVLPYYRPRTFPGIKGRFRSKPPVQNYRKQIYRGRNNIDLAARYSNSIGALDFGVSYFDGTSRDPRLERNNTGVIQNYDLIKQVGLDLQLTLGAFLGKAEWITREQITDENTRSRSHVSVLGGEYAFYGIFESEADLTLFAEWNHDTGGNSLLQDDLFFAARYSFNDILDTDITVALIDDRDFDTKTLNIEFNRRLSDSFSLTVEAFKFLEEDQGDVLSQQIVNDEYVALDLSFSY
ncbi:MAG: hypothetical protein F4073_02545 [Rhodobacteraceae bacterium]|nr:hypothetical protein [Paracoccaceae bacterium]MYI90815.1 hypothetical protein [Paracoccaceae bacterium]